MFDQPVDHLVEVAGHLAHPVVHLAEVSGPPVLVHPPVSHRDVVNHRKENRSL